LVIIITVGEEYKSWSSSLCSFLHPSVTSSPSRQSIPRNTEIHNSNSYHNTPARKLQCARTCACASASASWTICACVLVCVRCVLARVQTSLWRHTKADSKQPSNCTVCNLYIS
jgi:hypothetical protein